jgi:hypothetical protein
VKRGIKNIKDLGQVVQFKGENALNIWSGDKCNNLTGSDSTIFPPFLTPQDPVAAFTPEICRCVSAKRFVAVVNQSSEQSFEHSDGTLFILTYYH